MTSASVCRDAIVWLSLMKIAEIGITCIYRKLVSYYWGDSIDTLKAWPLAAPVLTNPLESIYIPLVPEVTS